MEDDYDYGGWLTEDLKEYYDSLMKTRDKTELYSDRVELNKMRKNILREIQSRGRK
jgi:predicted metalloprotease with PDZ domain